MPVKTIEEAARFLVAARRQLLESNSMTSQYTMDCAWEEMEKALINAQPLTPPEPTTWPVLPAREYK